MDRKVEFAFFFQFSISTEAFGRYFNMISTDRFPSVVS